MNRKGIQFGVKDTWSLDATLNPILLSALKKFKEVITAPERASWVGVPSLVMEKINPETYSHTDEELEQGSKLWLEILDKMIYAFDSKNQPKLSNYDFTFDHKSEKKEEGLVSYKIVPTNQAEYDRYRADEKEHEEKVKEGHSLLGTYYQCLWY